MQWFIQQKDKRIRQYKRDGDAYKSKNKKRKEYQSRYKKRNELEKIREEYSDCNSMDVNAMSVDEDSTPIDEGIEYGQHPTESFSAQSECTNCNYNNGCKCGESNHSNKVEADDDDVNVETAANMDTSWVEQYFPWNN